MIVDYNGRIKMWLVVDNNSCADQVLSANVYFLKYYLIFVTVVTCTSGLQ